VDHFMRWEIWQIRRSELLGQAEAATYGRGTRPLQAFSTRFRVRLRVSVGELSHRFAKRLNLDYPKPITGQAVPTASPRAAFRDTMQPLPR
jgi:hypothetical protein